MESVIDARTLGVSRASRHGRMSDRNVSSTSKYLTMSP